MSRAPWTIGAYAVLYAAIGPWAYAELTPLHVIPIESRLAQPSSPADTLQLEVQVQDAAALARFLGAQPPPSGSNSLVLSLTGYPAHTQTSNRTWLEPTFVIDFNDPDVAKLHERLQSRRAAKPTLDELTAFVTDEMDGSVDRGWDIASRVARELQGDCTEHAVLLTALARRSGWPARVVLGVALVEQKNRFSAYGHAWSEVFDGSAWRLADAALPAQPGVTVRYVPNAILEQEGPGYAIDVIVQMSRWVQRVVIVGNASQGEK